MRYRVIWDPRAFKRLRRAWIAAHEPHFAIQAFDEIEEKLSIDAHEVGESRDGDNRVLIVPPIGVIFHANPDQGEVLVLDAWMFVRRKR